MQIVKVISEHKKTKRASRVIRDGEGGAHIESQKDRFHSKVGFIEAIVKNEFGELVTRHIPDSRPKKKKETV